MNLKCLFGGHAWDGCECSKCGKTRPSVSASEALPLLTKALADQSLEVASAAATALKRLGDASAVPALFESLSSSNSRKYAVFQNSVSEAIQELADETCIETILDAFASEDYIIKAAAVTAMAHTRSSEFVKPLAASLTATNPLKPKILAALAKCGGADVIPVLISHFEQDPAVRGIVSTALYELDADEAASMVLLHCVSDGSKEAETLWATNKCICQRKWDALTEALGMGCNSRIIVDALRWTIDDGLGEQLVLVLSRRPMTATVVEVCSLLERNLSPEAIRLLLNVLITGCPKERVAAAMVLSENGNEHASAIAESLSEAIYSYSWLYWSPRAWGDVSQILSNLASPVCIPLILGLPGGAISGQYITWTTVGEILQSYKSDSVKELCDSLNLTRVNRCVIAEALGSICDPSAVPSLVELCHDGTMGSYFHEHSGISAAQALSKILTKHADQIPLIRLRQIEALKDLMYVSGEFESDETHVFSLASLREQARAALSTDMST